MQLLQVAVMTGLVTGLVTGFEPSEEISGLMPHAYARRREKIRKTRHNPSPVTNSSPALHGDAHE